MLYEQQRRRCSYHITRCSIGLSSIGSDTLIAWYAMSRQLELEQEGTDELDSTVRSFFVHALHEDYTISRIKAWPVAQH